MSAPAFASVTDLLSPLAPLPEDAGRPVGTLRGPPWEGLGAGLEVWTGTADGWRSLGELAGAPTAGIMRHRGRLYASLTFDLGPARMRVAADEAEVAA